ncbi:class I SAM-dependent methyltransferase [Halalkalibacter okhensis]|uniref:SAM-dependent methyltransferase n=1 Tax=Halalkalibacter okhensis TaxID=333138 RepID=A0A0B0ICE4_9BACI|nr:class I SAM-dependent methyltransferase [Halalkalibacter okhensis]KHF38950.1 SAM-dependent methyltransferase [Halalkalibacter okhensis]
MNVENTKANVQAQFGKNAQNYVTSKTHAKGEDLQKLLAISSFKGGEHCLDIATGGGHVANAVAPLVTEVTALDLTTEILKVAREFIESNGHTNVKFVQGDAEKLPFDDECFDVVTCRIAAHHFPNVLAFIKEAFRVIKLEGTLLFIDNVAPENNDFDSFYNKIEKDRDRSHHRAWKKSEWIKMLEQTGFEIDESYRFKKLFLFSTWCEMMKLEEEQQVNLSDYIVGAPKEVQDKFRINIKDDKVESFMGESILIKAIKPLI